MGDYFRFLAFFEASINSKLLHLIRQIKSKKRLIATGKLFTNLQRNRFSLRLIQFFFYMLN